MLQPVLNAFGIDAGQSSIMAFGTGLINKTWKVAARQGVFILQNINTSVFKNPQHIAENLSSIQNYLNTIAPGYVFAAPLPAANGQYLVHQAGKYYRLFPFVAGSHAVDSLVSADQAREAARQFGQFTRLLDGYDVASLHYTLPDFHNLPLRLSQFNEALQRAAQKRISRAAKEISRTEAYADIALVYEDLTRRKEMPLRVIHHDTKISNVLFDAQNNGLCVIDLDTVMPGFYISDVGDMMRTYLCGAGEEETDLRKIHIRPDFFEAIYEGYMHEMGDVLSPYEKSLFIYSGKFIIYMQAVRFLADYLNGDTYYPTRYPEHNLVRAKNQLALLDQYVQAEGRFEEIAGKLNKK